MKKPRKATIRIVWAEVNKDEVKNLREMVERVRAVNPKSTQTYTNLYKPN